MSDFLSKHMPAIVAGIGIVSASAGLGYIIGNQIGKHGSSTNVQPMLSKSYATSDPCLGYMMKNALREPPFLKDLREETIKRCEKSLMLLDPIEGQLLRLILKSIQAKRCLEIGVFTGYNACNMALAVPDDGEVVACDIEESYINIGRPFWDPEVANKIKVRIAPASETLDKLIEEGQSGSFDFVFIDADKVSYDTYYEKGLVLLRKGGILGVDNTLWGGRVLLDEAVQSMDTKAIHALNLKIKADDRIDFCQIKVGDGTTLCLKK